MEAILILVLLVVIAVVLLRVFDRTALRYPPWSLR
jgi:hypothetical protein